MPTQPMNIFQRINEVRKKIDYLKKDTTVRDSGGYQAISHDKVTGFLREHLIEAGVVIVPTLVSCEVKDTGTTTSKGTPWVRFEATYDVKFISTDAGQSVELAMADCVVMRVAAHALDTGDKAPGKALSYATKYAMLKMFNIETGEEDEERPQDVQGGMPEEAQKEWESKIAALKKGEDPSALWKEIKAACEAANDRQTATRLYARITARASALKKKAGPDAATTH